LYTLIINQIQSNLKGENVSVSIKSSTTARPNVESGDTLANVLRRHIADEILEGHIQPGTRLDEQGLATRFGVSRTPIREALRQLQAARLIDIRPHRGAVVIPVDEKYLDYLFETAAELEGLSARFAAVRMTVIERKRLADHYALGKEAARNGDSEAYANANRLFHATIVEGTHNSVLAEVVDRCRIQTGPYRKAQFHLPDRMASSNQEHYKILEAVEGQDSIGAYNAMRTHVSAVALAALSCILGY
jgi:DNA-binding GntR family transcriptional regulator